MVSFVARMGYTPREIRRDNNLDIAVFAVVVLGLVVLGGVGCASRGTKSESLATESSKTNQVVQYLDGAERQAETDEQRQEIMRALEDMRTLDAASLKNRRYADYDNVPGKWTLAELLQKYFVPSEPRLLDETSLYRDAQSPRAREVVGQQLRALRERRQAIPKP